MALGTLDSLTSNAECFGVEGQGGAQLSQSSARLQASQLKPSGARTEAKVEESRVSTDTGVPRMTPESLLDICTKNQGWIDPELNDNLHLQYKGFRKIENLQPYVNVRTLWLESNGISVIEGLEAMPRLIALYLQSNVVKRIDGLGGLKALQILNLAHNSISKVEGLANLPRLEMINLSANKIDQVADLQGLMDAPTLKNVNVSTNYLEEGDALLGFFEKALPNLECLYINHNPCTRLLKDGRRRLVSSLKHLSWMDERKVDEQERLGCEAWAIGGKEAEQEAKRNHILKEKDDKEESFRNYQRTTEAAAERYRAQKEAKAASDSAREEAAAELERTGVVPEGWVEAAARSSAAASKVFKEPLQQEKLHAKVQAFLSRRPEAAGSEAFLDQVVDAETSPESENSDHAEAWWSKRKAAAELLEAADAFANAESDEGSHKASLTFTEIVQARMRETAKTGKPAVFVPPPRLCPEFVPVTTRAPASSGMKKSAWHNEAIEHFLDALPSSSPDEATEPSWTVLSAPLTSSSQQKGSVSEAAKVSSQQQAATPAVKTAPSSELSELD